MFFAVSSPIILGSKYCSLDQFTFYPFLRLNFKDIASNITLLIHFQAISFNLEKQKSALYQVFTSLRYISAFLIRVGCNRIASPEKRIISSV